MSEIRAWPAWDGPTIEGQSHARSHHRSGEYKRSPWEWMPRPFGGRIMLAKNKKNGGGIYLQVVPGPAGLWQIVRVDLGSPVARGFLNPEDAKEWVARALHAGVLPEGVVVVEPPMEPPREVP